MDRDERADPLLSNIYVRKAIRQAIDVPGILAAAYDGVWQRANAIIPRPWGWATGPGAGYDRDVAKAQAYLRPPACRGKVSLTIIDARPTARPPRSSSRTSPTSASR